MLSYGEDKDLPFCYGSVCLSLFKINADEKHVDLVINEGGKKVVDLYITHYEIKEIIKIPAIHKITCVSSGNTSAQNKLYAIVREHEIGLVWMDVMMLSKNLERWIHCAKKPDNPWWQVNVCKSEFINFAKGLM